MTKTQVVNVRTDKFDVYIGRQTSKFPGSPLGNPYHIGPLTRDEVCDLYEVRFDELCWRAGAVRDELEPYHIGPLTRDEACDRYEERFDELCWREGRARDELERLVTLQTTLQRPLRLGCWCAPQRCHGLTIAKYLDARLK